MFTNYMHTGGIAKVIHENEVSLLFRNDGFVLVLERTEKH